MKVTTIIELENQSKITETIFSSTEKDEKTKSDENDVVIDPEVEDEDARPLNN